VDHHLRQAERDLAEVIQATEIVGLVILNARLRNALTDIRQARVQFDAMRDARGTPPDSTA
jgi:hypothetical protein